MKNKKRLDVIVAERYPQYSRNQIQSFIMQGKVFVNGKAQTKAGTPIAASSAIGVEHEEPKYVSRAGFKLEKALSEFALNVQGLVALDAGLSTGGFTDCLLQHGVAKVYGVDVGRGQAHEKIRADDRVVVMERTNLRTLDLLPERVDIVTLDVSFISVLKLIANVYQLTKSSAVLIVLIKPQFEAGRDDVGRGGIIKDTNVHQKVVESVVEGIQAAGFSFKALIESPILGTEGNKEFLAYFQKREDAI